MSRGDNGDSDCIQDRGITCSEARGACILEWLSLVVTVGPKAQWLAPRARVLVTFWGRRDPRGEGGLDVAGRGPSMWLALCPSPQATHHHFCGPHSPSRVAHVGRRAWGRVNAWVGDGTPRGAESSCEVLQAYFCPHGPCPERAGGRGMPFARDEPWPQSGRVACSGSQLKPGLWAAVASAEDAVGLRAASMLAWCP